MFYITNKDRIISVFIALSTVLVLFLLAGVFMKTEVETIETAINTAKLLPIYSVNTEEKKIALTINCAWSQMP